MYHPFRYLPWDILQIRLSVKKSKCRICLENPFLSYFRFTFKLIIWNVSEVCDLLWYFLTNIILLPKRFVWFKDISISYIVHWHISNDFVLIFTSYKCHSLRTIVVLLPRFAKQRMIINRNIKFDNKDLS